MYSLETSAEDTKFIQVLCHYRLTAEQQPMRQANYQRVNRDGRDSARSSLPWRESVVYFPKSRPAPRMCVLSYFTIPYGATTDANTRPYPGEITGRRFARCLRGNLRRNDCENLRGRKRDDTNIGATTLYSEEVLSQSSRPSTRAVVSTLILRLLGRKREGARLLENVK